MPDLFTKSSKIIRKITVSVALRVKTFSTLTHTLTKVYDLRSKRKKFKLLNLLFLEAMVDRLGL